MAKKATVKEEEISGITQYNPVTAGLADLRQRYEGKIFDLTTAEGEKAARAAKREHVMLRTSLETVRKEIKEPALRHCQLIDSEARRITAEILKTEEPIAAQIEAEEKRLFEIEAARVAAIKTKIDQACLVGMGSTKSTRAELEGWLGQLMELTFDESFEEFVDVAEQMRDAEIERLRALLEQRLEADARAAQIAEEKAELDRLKAEQAEREAAERARIAKEREAHEAEMKAKRAALDEEDRKAALARAEADRVAREKREAADAEAKKVAEAERVRFNQEREAQERADKEARAARAEEDRKADEARKAEQARIDAEREEWNRRAAEEKAERDRAQFLREQAAREELAAKNAAETRLRDAAPAMLAALLAVEKDPNFSDLTSETFGIVQDAIALARLPAPIKP